MLRGLALLAILAISVGGAINNKVRKAAAKHATGKALEGKYKTIDFKASRFDSPLRWVGLEVMNHGRATISTADGSSENISFNPDTTSKTIAVYAFADSLTQSTLMYEQLDDSTLYINGLYKHDSIEVTLRVGDKKYLLMERGFHWINERPFHR